MAPAVASPGRRGSCENRGTKCTDRYKLYRSRQPPLPPPRPSTCPSDSSSTARATPRIGSAARALANTGAGPLWVVEAEQFDRTQAARLAAGADATLDAMQVVRTLEEALAPCVDLVFTTGRAVEGLPLLTPREAAARLLESAKSGEVALVFGDEVRGLTNEQLRRAPAIATIPTVEEPR